MLFLKIKFVKNYFYNFVFKGAFIIEGALSLTTGTLRCTKEVLMTEMEAVTFHQMFKTGPYIRTFALSVIYV